MYGCSKDWFSFHLGCHRSAVSLSALNVSPLSQTIAPRWGPDLCFSSPTCRRSGPTNTTVFPLVPSSYWVLRESIHPFLPVRYSCPLSAGVPHTLLCLKVYSWREMYSTYTCSSTILFSACIFSNYTFVWIYSQEWGCSPIWPTLVF